MYYNFKADGPSAKAYYLGEYASGTQIDISSRYPNYALLTADNFIVQSKSRSVSTTGIRAGRHRFDNGIEEGGYADISVAGTASLSAPTISYNSSTGKLSFSMSLSITSSAGIWSDTNEARSSDSGSVTAKVYLLPEIENI